MKHRRPIRILARRHEAVWGVMQVSVVELPAPPVAVVSPVESIMGRWWFRAGGYPVGRIFGNLLL